MSVEKKETLSWTDPGQTIDCNVDGASFADELDGSVPLRLRVDEILEEFDGRRVLVASARDILDDELDISEDARQSLLHPTYLVEETNRLDEAEREWPEQVKELIREPIAIEKQGGLRRSIFVDNVGVSVGDLVDLVRGELGIDQVEMIFSAVGRLFADLHEAGWVHLGLTPWNVRVFDRERADGFPQVFLAGPVATEKREQAEEKAEEPEQVDAIEEEENPFVGRERTVVELKPFGENEEDEVVVENKDEPSTDDEDAGKPGAEEPNGGLRRARGIGLDDPQFFDSEVSWVEVSGETSAAEDEMQTSVAAIFDGIDRLYQSGKVDDEIAVTPGFSAPELLSGMGSDDGESADIFSLGMFLYFLIAGVVPPASVYTRYAPAIPARNFRPTFPPGVQAIISRATRPSPNDRFASVRSMVEAFEDAFAVMDQRAEVSSSDVPAMRLECDTHIGIAKRKRNPTNQDSVFSGTSEDGRFALIVVADGVSTASYGSGDLASTALTEAAAQVWEDVLPTYLMDEPFDEVEIIQSILNRANHRIVNYVNEHFTPFRGSPHEVMGSTALVAVVVDGVFTLGSLGDSRVYLQRGAAMEQMTIDHNLWTLSILEGVQADTALAMPHGDALARCLGTFIIEDGMLEAVNPQPDLFRFQVIRGDTVLLTTDGLVDFAGTNVLASEDNILSVMLGEPDPALACLELILLANRGGGGDNIGLSVARFF